MTDLAVVIVTWNVRELAIQAIESLLNDLNRSGLDSVVYVVDNASGDGTAEAIASQFPQVKLTASDENLGFVRGNNLALRQIGFGNQDADLDNLPKAIYLLNPDTITQPGATRQMYDTLMGDPEVGLVGAQLFYEDGSFQHGAFAFPGLSQLWTEFFPTPGRLIESSFNGRYPLSFYQQPEPFPVDFTLGATMMLRREVVQATGMFDEGFFMYCEEIDWAWRIKKAGWEVYCMPQARVTHLAGKSTSQIRAQSQIYLWTSRLRLFEKHYPGWKRWIARKMVAIGMGRKIKQLQQQPSSDARQQLIRAYQDIREMARKA